MLWTLILILAVLQGLTELLPVSSSGHLAIGQAIFQAINPSASMSDSQKSLISITLHFGTLVAIVIYYRDRIRRLATRDFRLLGLLFLASLPAAVVGIIVKYTVGDRILHLPMLAGFGFLVTGAVLWFGGRSAGATQDDSLGLRCENLGLRGAIGIGFAQALALLPGISRSGTTIVAGLRAGLRREESAAFSFLMAIPAIVGAMILEIPELINLANHSATTAPPAADKIALQFMPLLVAMLVSALVAYFALGWLVRWLRTGKLHNFAWYVVPLGLAVLFWRFALLAGLF